MSKYYPVLHGMSKKYQMADSKVELINTSTILFNCFLTFECLH